MRPPASGPPPPQPGRAPRSAAAAMGCLGNSKTEDQRNEEKAQREANKKIEKQLQKDKQVYRATHRLLLLGKGGAGGAGPGPAALRGAPQAARAEPAPRPGRALPSPQPARGLFFWGARPEGGPQGADSAGQGLQMGRGAVATRARVPFPGRLSLPLSLSLSRLPPRSFFSLFLLYQFHID